MTRFRPFRNFVRIGAVVFSAMVCILTFGLFGRSFFIRDLIGQTSVTGEMQCWNEVGSIQGFLYFSQSIIEPRSEAPSSKTWLFSHGRHNNRKPFPHAVFGFDYGETKIALQDALGTRKGEIVKRQMALPHWFIILATGIAPALAIRRWHRRRRFIPGCCNNCGYDLRASPARCPECGAGDGSSAMVAST